MVHKKVYAAGLSLFVAAFATTIASIAVPRWINYDSFDLSGSITEKTLGLHSRCIVRDGRLDCSHYPTDDECTEDRNFCTLWRTVGFLMSFTVVVEGVTLVSLIVMITSGVQKRLAGRSVVCILLGLITLLQAASMSIIAYVASHDERFFPGNKLDTSWILCTTSWAVALVTAVGIWTSVHVLPLEGDYEFLGTD